MGLASSMSNNALVITIAYVAGGIREGASGRATIIFGEWRSREWNSTRLFTNPLTASPLVFTALFTASLPKSTRARNPASYAGYTNYLSRKQTKNKHHDIVLFVNFIQHVTGTKRFHRFRPLLHVQAFYARKNVLRCNISPLRVERHAPGLGLVGK